MWNGTNPHQPEKREAVLELTPENNDANSRWAFQRWWEKMCFFFTFSPYCWHESTTSFHTDIKRACERKWTGKFSLSKFFQVPKFLFCRSLAEKLVQLFYFWNNNFKAQQTKLLVCKQRAVQLQLSHANAPHHSDPHSQKHGKYFKFSQNNTKTRPSSVSH